METFNNQLCYVILFENHQHGGTHGMTNRLRGYTRQKRLGNTVIRYRMVCFASRAIPISPGVPMKNALRHKLCKERPYTVSVTICF